MNQSRLYHTAIHEAGHAVLAAVLKKKFRSVTIIPTQDANGHIRYWTNRESLIDIVQGIGNRYLRIETIERRVRREVMISYAGYAAQLRTGVDDQEGAKHDLGFIIDIGIKHASQNADTFLEECFAATRQLLEGNWSYIEKVAELLLEKKTIFHKEIMDIIAGNQQGHASAEEAV